MTKMKFVIVLFVVCLITIVHPSNSQPLLSKDFYKTSCPQAESIIQKVFDKDIRQGFALAAGALRTFFHDCLIGGCDGSVLVGTSNKDGEKDAIENLFLPNITKDAIDEMKQQVEAACPGVVSCADILAITARDSAVWAGAPTYELVLGRRDGLESKASNVKGHLPEPEMSVDELLPFFKSHNLSMVDMVTLSGSHSFGIAHCGPVEKRLYNFSPKSPLDPTLNKTYAETVLMKNCTPGSSADVNKFVPMDPDSIFQLNNNYYQLLIEGRGLFTSDQDMYLNPFTKEVVLRFAKNKTDFLQSFSESMQKVGVIGVKTGSEGIIRKVCSSNN